MFGASSSFRPSGEMAAPHLPSLEALALAIEVQGSHTPDHLLRARGYAQELARRLGVDQAGVETLQLAAILHDVGELAVPSSILSKSGDLSAPEFEKMKSHAAVGALIVERAGLPLAAARMVRSHHERWDGGGYPDGLRQEAIPLGARILAAADCLAGSRPGMALQALQAGAGTLFDPRIVQLAVESHQEIERAVRLASLALPGLDFRAAIGAARREERLLYALTAELGNSLSLPETLSTFDASLRDLVGYHCIVVYRVQEGRLSPIYVNGEGAQRFCALDLSAGAGPSGLAAATRQPVLNGDPWADAQQAASDALADVHLGRGAATLRSALAIPLESGGEAVAVVSLYHTEPDAFGTEDVRILLAIRGKLTLAVAHALEQERADQVAAVDALTGLPNRRALFQRLDADLARCRRNCGTLALLVCEIDGLPRLQRQAGPAAVQRLYKALADGLRRICREDDCVARMDENFVLALGGFSACDFPEKRHLIESLLAELAPPGLVPRIAAAYYPDDGAYAEDLLACADLRLNPAYRG